MPADSKPKADSRARTRPGFFDLPRDRVKGPQRRHTKRRDVPPWLAPHLTERQRYWYEREHGRYAQVVNHMLNRMVGTGHASIPSVVVVSSYEVAAALGVGYDVVQRGLSRAKKIGLLHVAAYARREGGPNIYGADVTLPPDRPKLPEGGDL